MFGIFPGLYLPELQPFVHVFGYKFLSRFWCPLEYQKPHTLSEFLFVATLNHYFPSLLHIYIYCSWILSLALAMFGLELVYPEFWIVNCELWIVTIGLIILLRWFFTIFSQFIPLGLMSFPKQSIGWHFVVPVPAKWSEHS